MCEYYSEMGQVKMKTFVSTYGIAAECLAECKPMLLHNSRIHVKFHPGMDGFGEDLEPSILSKKAPVDPIQAIYYPVVLKHSQEPLAVICVREKKKGMAFHRQDLVCLGVLARQAALTLRNVEKHEGLLEIARTRDMRHTQMASLNSIRTMQMEAMASLSSHCPVNEIIKRMNEVMCEILGVEICKLHLVEEGGKMVRMLGENRFQDKVTEVAKALESNVVCRALRENETLLFDLATLTDEDPGVRFEVDGMEMLNSLTVPLRGDLGHVFGLLQLVNKQTGSFTGSDELVVHMAANAFKTLLDACLLAEVRFEIGLGSVESKPNEIAQVVLEKALMLVAADAGQVLVLVDKHTQLRRFAEITPSGERVGTGSRGFTNQVSSSAQNYEATQGLAGHVVQTRSTLNVPMLRDETRFDAGIDIKLDYEGLHSFLCCPMLTGTGECMGVIQLAKFGVGQFTERNVQLLQILAKQAGTMMWNRERYEFSMESALQQVIHVTESVMWCLEVQPNVDLLVNRIAESAMNIVPCENVVLLFRAQSNQENVWTKIANNVQDVWPFQKRPNRTAFTGKKPHRDVKIPLHNGIMSEVFKSRKSVEVQRPDHRLVLEYENLSVSEVNNMLVIPIFRNEEDAVVGVLALINKRESFVLEDSRKLEHYRSSIFPAVDCIGRCEGWELPDFLQTMKFI